MAAGLNLHEKLCWSGAMNSPRLLARHPLDNELTLEFWDHSRPVAGDRWFVCLSARIAVPVRTETLPPELKAHAAQVVGALGEEIIFSHRGGAQLYCRVRGPGPPEGYARPNSGPGARLLRACRFRRQVHPQKIRRTAATGEVAEVGYKGRPRLTAPALPCPIILMRSAQLPRLSPRYRGES